MATRSSILLLLLLCMSCTSSSPEQEVKTDPSDPFQAALSNINEKIQDNMGNADLLIERANLYYTHEGYDEAIEDIQAAIQLNGENPDFHHLLADVYLDYYKSKKAILTLEATAAKFDERVPTLLKLSEFYYILKQNKEAMRTVDRVLKQDPLSADAFYMKGMIYKEQGEVKKAINSLRTCVEMKSDYTDGWLALGEMAGDQKDSRALQYFDNALRIEPDNITILHAKAFYLQNNNKIPAAIEIYKKINEIDRHYADAYFNSGILYMELDSIAKAKDLFNITTSVDVTHYMGYFYRGITNELLGNLSSAEQDYKQVLSINPTFERAKEAIRNLNKNKE